MFTRYTYMSMCVIICLAIPPYMPINYIYLYKDIYTNTCFLAFVAMAAVIAHVETFMTLHT